MPQTDRGPTSDVLRRFQPLTLLDPEQLEQIAGQAKLLKAARGTCLIDIGSQEPRSLFLLVGELELIAADGARHRVRNDETAARGPICKLRPSCYRVTAISEILYLWVEGPVIEQLASSPGAGAMLVEETVLQGGADDLIHDHATHGVMFDVLDDLNRGQIMVPSDPDVAVSVGRALGRYAYDDRLFSASLSACPALTLKTLRAARAADPERRQVRSCRQAIERLGGERVYALAASCILRESLRSRCESVRRRMTQWWQKSVKVATISRVLAGMSERFDPELAGLIGALHSIGEPVLLQHAHRHDDLRDPTLLDDVLCANRAELGRILLTYWGLPRAMIEGTAMSGNWDYRHGGEADYVDILLVALWHASIGEERRPRIPPLEEIPAAEKLGLAEPAPRLSLKIIDAANTAVEQTERLLGDR